MHIYGPATITITIIIVKRRNGLLIEKLSSVLAWNRNVYDNKETKSFYLQVDFCVLRQLSLDNSYKVYTANNYNIER